MQTATMSLHDCNISLHDSPSSTTVPSMRGCCMVHPLSSGPRAPVRCPSEASSRRSTSRVRLWNSKGADYGTIIIEDNFRDLSRTSLFASQHAADSSSTCAGQAVNRPDTSLCAHDEPLHDLLTIAIRGSMAPVTHFGLAEISQAWTSEVHICIYYN